MLIEINFGEGESFCWRRRRTVVKMVSREAVTDMESTELVTALIKHESL